MIYSYLKKFVPTLLLLNFIACNKIQTVEVITASKSEVESTVLGVSSGTVKAERSADLAFGTVGRVQSINVKVGDIVKQGQILAELENGDLKSSYEVSHAELKRVQSIQMKGAMSISQNRETQRIFDVATSNYEKSFIRAPFSGIITIFNLELGELSQITAVIPKPLISIIDLAPRYIEMELDELDLSKVKLGMPARIKIPAARKEPFLGTVRKLIPYVSSVKEQDRTTDLELNINSEGIDLPVGASADVEVITEHKINVLSLPTKTILGRTGNRFVYALEDGKAKKHSVGLGLQNYDKVEILQGISEGTKIILPSDKIELTEGALVKELK